MQKCHNNSQGRYLVDLSEIDDISVLGKITGMLLEIDNSDLVHMLEDQGSLKGKVSYIIILPMVRSRTYWASQKLPQISTVILRICIGKVV